MVLIRMDVPEAQIDDLRRRLAGARWSGELIGPGPARDLPVDYLRDLAEYFGAWAGILVAAMDQGAVAAGGEGEQTPPFPVATEPRTDLDDFRRWRCRK